MTRHGTGSVETIEVRLARKAKVADTATFATTSRGQMKREKRHNTNGPKF
jgi:hypothetical protein